MSADPEHVVGLDALVAELRAARLEISSSEIIDAARLLRRLAETAPTLDRAALGPKLRPVFCKNSHARAAYDSGFARWVAQPTVERFDEPAPVIPVPTRTHDRARVWLPLGALMLLALALVAGVHWYRSGQQTIQLPPAIETPQSPAATQPATAPLPTPTAAGDSASTTFYPAYRRNEVLRPWLAWLLVFAPGMVLLGLMLSAAGRWGRFIDRITAPGQVFLASWSERLKLLRLVPTLRASVLGRLDSHARIAANDPALLNRRPQLHVARTLAATLRNGGVFSARYRDQRTRPSYLILVDAARSDSLLMLWAARWRAQGLDVDIRRLQRDAAGAPLGWLSAHIAGAAALTPLDALPPPGTAQRLVFLGDGNDLLDAVGDWQPWARRAALWRWSQRALFTTVVARDWGAQETRLAEEFFVLPLEDAALASWSQWLARAQFPEVRLSQPERYPPLLHQVPARYLRSAEDLEQHGEPLAAAEVHKLIAQLQLYLGENGFYWLCCCAVPPTLDAELTVLLGEQYFRRAGVEHEDKFRHHLSRTYPRLARLPWLERSHLPNWLRLALLARLPNAIQDEVRTVVSSLLSNRTPQQHGTLQLSLGASAQRGSDDSLYVGFMQGYTASQLMLRVPKEWHCWLSRLAPPQSRWRRFRSWLRVLMAWQGIAGGWGATRVRRVASAVLLLSLSTLTAASLVPLDKWPSHLRTMMLIERNVELLAQHAADISSMAVSSDGMRIVTGSDLSLSLWDAKTLRPLHRMDGHRTRLAGVAFSSDGTRIVSGGIDRTVRLWDARTGQLLDESMRGHEDRGGMDFSPDGALVAIPDGDGTLRVWDTRTGQPFGAPIRGIGDGVCCVAFSPDGMRIVTVRADDIRGERANRTTDSLRLWDTRTGQLLSEARGHDYISSLAFSPDGSRIVTGSYDNSLLVWNARAMQPLGEPVQAHVDPVEAVAFNRDGTRIVSGSLDGTLVVWDARTGRALGEPMRGHMRGVSGVAFSPDSNRIFSAGADGILRSWSTSPSPTSLPRAAPNLLGLRGLIFELRYSTSPFESRSYSMFLLALAALVLAGAWRTDYRIGRSQSRRASRA